MQTDADVWSWANVYALIVNRKGLLVSPGGLADRVHKAVFLPLGQHMLATQFRNSH